MASAFAGLPSNSTPALLASFVDASAAAVNTLFPDTTNYSDARILILVIGGFFSVLAALLYATGACSPRIAAVDVLSSQYSLQAAGEGRGFVTSTAKSKFGGAQEYWTERSWTTMTLDNALRQPSRGDVRVRVTTLRLNASDESACFLIPLSSTSVYERATLQLARSENGPLCQFTVTLPRFLSLQQQYAAAGTAPMLPATLTLESQASASGTQIVDFEIQVDDAKESAYSRGYLSRSIPTNSSGGRMVAASVSLMPSIFDDRSYFTRAQGGSVSTGYRAAFPLLNVTLADVGRDDKLVITFNPVAMTLYTERWPRLGILQVLGTLLGLGVGLFLLFKFLHDILDAACGCRSLNRAITCWALRGCKGERPRGVNVADDVKPPAALTSAERRGSKSRMVVRIEQQQQQMPSPGGPASARTAAAAAANSAASSSPSGGRPGFSARSPAAADSPSPAARTPSMLSPVREHATSPAAGLEPGTGTASPAVWQSNPIGNDRAALGAAVGGGAPSTRILGIAAPTGTAASPAASLRSFQSFNISSNLVAGDGRPLVRGATNLNAFPGVRK